MLFKCDHCSRVSDAEPIKSESSSCPTCGCLALDFKAKAKGFPIFRCSPCKDELVTYFVLRDGQPLTHAMTRWMQRDLSKDEIVTLLEITVAEADERERREEATTERRCINETCRKYLHSITGAKKCEECKRALHVVSVVKFCANPKCERAGQEPTLFQFRSGVCRLCGNPPARRHGALAEEVAR
jgi:hypothetical protein